MRIKNNEIISKMTLEEKAGLCSGLNFWQTKAVERLDIPSVMMSDGPHGLRKQQADQDDLLAGSVPSTCYPTAAGLACSWDRNLLAQVGQYLGRECQAEGIDILLGPSANIKRSPLCGRNFEYFSEDPYLSSEMATHHIKGVQSQGVGTSLKHFAANNQEYRRLLTDTLVDERTLREIYLAGFEPVVKKASPMTIMCAYNRLNGEFCSENHRLLTEILKEEWGYEGVVVSDWGAVNDRVAGLAAGLDLEMPSCNGDRDRLIVEAVRSGKLDESVLDETVSRLLSLIYETVRNRKPGSTYSKEEHHRFAREAAAQCMVLLKNEDNLLPLGSLKTLAVIGAFARHPRFQGSGSSHVNHSLLDIPLDEIRKSAESAGIRILYEEGYPIDVVESRYSAQHFRSASDAADERRIESACRSAETADAAVIFTGLPETYESEGYDRKHISIPEGHRELIEAVARVQPNTAVVLSNGAPIEMPWLNNVKAVLEAYLGGQAFGGATADILFGKINPSGKLAETFPMRVQDTPSYLNFPGDGERVEYREGLFVGYRYYDSAQVRPLFPFGYGLSYTHFTYQDLKLDRKILTDNETLTVSVKVKNDGHREGKEIVQLYLRPLNSPVQRPFQELKGFEKISLQAGESGTVRFVLDRRAFSWYSPELKDWYAANGEYEIRVGGSSQHINLTDTVTISLETQIRKPFTRNSTLEELASHPEGKKIIDDLSAAMEGKSKMPLAEVMSMFDDMPLRSLHMLTEGLMNENMIKEILERVNKGNSHSGLLK